EFDKRRCCDRLRHSGHACAARTRSYRRQPSVTYPEAVRGRGTRKDSRGGARKVDPTTWNNGPNQGASGFVSSQAVTSSSAIADISSQEALLDCAIDQPIGKVAQIG